MHPSQSHVGVQVWSKSFCGSSAARWHRNSRALWVQTTQDVAIVRPHIKMLAGDYLCGEYLARDRGLDPQCKLCRSPSGLLSPPEDLEHLLTKCRATSDIRQSKLPGLLNTIAQFSPHNALLCNSNPSQLTQFILDCTSLNLTSDARIAPSSPGFISITRTCSDLIFAIEIEPDN